MAQIKINGVELHAAFSAQYRLKVYPPEALDKVLRAHKLKGKNEFASWRRMRDRIPK